MVECVMVILTSIRRFDYGYDKRRLQTVTDELGRVTTYAYDLLDRLLTLQLPDPDLGGPLTAPVYAYQYDILGRKKKETDPLGRVTEYEYDEVHNLLNVEQTDYNGITVVAVNQWVYDFGHRLTSVTDPLGRTTSFQYNALDNLIQTTQPDPDGAGPLAQPIWMWAYDVLSRQSYAIDPLGARADFAYQNVWRTVVATPPDPLSGSPGSYDTTTVMNGAGQATSYTDELGRETTYTYNAYGWLTGVILPDPDGPSNPLASPFSSITYNNVGNIASTTDHAHRTADYFYDARHRLIEVREVDPDGGGPLGQPSTFYAYDAASQLTSVTDPRGKVTSYEYDNLGRLKKVSEADPDDGGPLARPETFYAYDAASRLISVTDALAHTTSYQYNALDDLILMVLPDPDGVGPLASPEWEYTYDAASQLLSATDPLNHTTTYGYDNLGRMILATDPLSGQTAYNYDAVGNLKILTDPVGNDTLWNYDKRYRLTSEMNELGKTRYFEYDPVGNLTERTDRNGRVIEFTYDNLDRVTQEQWLGTGARTLTFVYDAYARLNSAGDVSATYRYAYDVVGQVALETQEIAGLAALAYEHTYDISGNLLTTSARLGVTVSPGDPPSISGGTYDFKNEFTYDNLNRLTKLTQQSQSGGNVVAEKRVDFAYNAVGQFTDIDRYQNLTGTQLVAHTDFGYDNLGRLTQIAHSKGANNLGTFNYTWDAASRITQIIDDYVGTSWDETHVYSYDNTDQLTSANHSVQSDEAYDFDANGNRDGSQTHLGATNSSTVIANNRVSTDGVYNYTYDDEGNLTKRTKISDGSYTDYTWDHRNRLIQVVSKTSAHVVTSQVDLEYNYLNRLIKEVIDADGAGSGPALDRYFSWVGDQIALQWDENASTSAIELTHRYLWGPMVDQLFTDEEVTSLTSAGTNRWALTNHLGSVTDLVTYDPGIDATTNIKHRGFDGFGNITFDSAPSVKEQFGFQGVMFEIVIGWGNHRERWYDSVAGEWRAQDPITFGGGDMNLDRMVGNHPTYATDPTGLIDPDLLDHANYDKFSPYRRQWGPFNSGRGQRTSSLTEEEERILLDLFQLSLDVAGIFEPTPFCDITSALISLGRRQFGDAIVNGISMIPYAGDTSNSPLN